MGRSEGGSFGSQNMGQIIWHVKRMTKRKFATAPISDRAMSRVELFLPDAYSYKGRNLPVEDRSIDSAAATFASKLDSTGNRPDLIRINCDS